MTATQVNSRTIAQVIQGQAAMEGGGVAIRRTFPTHRLDSVDPFLLLDHFGPYQIKAGDATGFPDHPHRGFETVTYVLDGQMEHRDSFGHRGTIGPGDVQWMTAGSGLVHSEMPGAEIVRKGGRLQGFQLWVNLPRRDKMTAPRYQEFKSSEIPTAQSADGSVQARIIAGSAFGRQGAVETRIPVTYIHLTFARGAAHEQEIPQTQNVLVYVISGQASLHGTILGEGNAALFANDGLSIRIANASDSSLDLLLLAGEPLHEPVARHGPFVMNTRDELHQALLDYQSGKMGRIL